MKVIETPIRDLFIIQPDVFQDTRGYFQETFNSQRFREHGILTEFVQDNESKSQKGVLRGLHFQKPPYAQAKLVRVIKGAVIDVAVDIRKGSPSYGKHYAVELSERNKTMMLVPEGFAHGFVVLEDETIFSYKCSNFYNKPAEDAILWSDPDLAINWGISNPILSEKDRNAGRFKDFNSPF